VKRARWEETILEQVSDWPNAVLASFDHTAIAEFHRRGTSIPLGITFYGAIVDVADYATRIGASWCFPNYPYVDREMVASLHDRGIRVVPWTPNRKREWERLREVGCDGVITDLPAEAVAWRDAEGRRN
jgi:glycerophosphoryl diester phosphodiesterase